MKPCFFVLLFIFAFTALLPSAAEAASGACSVCRKRLPARYLTDNRNRSYCSRKCFETTLPRCANCKKICRQGFLRGKGKTFCSQQCADEMFLPHCQRCGKVFRKGKKIKCAYGEFVYCLKCSDLPGCLVCELREKSMQQYRNGHYLCRRCNKNVISSSRDLERLFRQVRNTLAQKLNFRNDHLITLKLWQFDLKQRDASGNSTQEFGLYKYSGKEIYTRPLPVEFWREKKTTVRFENESCSILIMSDLPAFKAAEVIAHELAHDYMKHRWYFIKDELLREGFAELTAAEYNRISGNELWNFRMQNNPDPVYGNGYRLLKSYLDKGGWAEVERRLDAANYQAMPSELKK